MTGWLHVGLPKTGTTTLQREFFPRLCGLAYFGGKGTRLPPPVASDMRRLIVGLKSGGDRADIVEQAARFFAGNATRWNSARLPFLISEEGFSTTLPGSRFDRLDVLPAALRRVVGSSTSIILVVREPRSLLLSFYEQSMARSWAPRAFASRRAGGPPSIEEFLVFEHRRIRQGAFDTIFGAILRFDRVVAAYGAAFGRDRVHVLPFEPMQDDPQTFCLAWCRLLGIPPQILHLPRRNESGSARRRQILERFGIPPGDRRAVAFEEQFAGPLDLRTAHALFADHVERHCEPIRAQAAAAYAALADGLVRPAPVA